MLRGVLIIHGNLKVHNANCHNHSYSHSQDDREGLSRAKGLLSHIVCRISYIDRGKGAKNGPIDKNVICHNSLKFARDIGFLFSHTRVCPGMCVCVSEMHKQGPFLCACVCGSACVCVSVRQA